MSKYEDSKLDNKYDEFDLDIVESSITDTKDVDKKDHAKKKLSSGPCLALGILITGEIIDSFQEGCINWF